MARCHNTRITVVQVLCANKRTIGASSLGWTSKGTSARRHGQANAWAVEKGVAVIDRHPGLERVDHVGGEGHEPLLNVIKQLVACNWVDMICTILRFIPNCVPDEADSDEDVLSR